MNPRKIVKALIPKSTFKKIEPWGHLAEAVTYNTVNGFPGKKFKIIGVTGTNGKTTAVFLIHQMLHQAGYKVGMMSTVAYGVGDDIRRQREHMTNVNVSLLMKRLKWFQQQDIEWLVMETTSIALAQNRVWGMPYSMAVLTNVTQDHLDYHGTFKNYLNAKRLLFKRVNANRQGLRLGIINADDPAASLFAKDVEHHLSYGINRGQLKAVEVKSDSQGSDFTVESEGREDLDLRVNLPGQFNVYNALAAAAVGLALDVKPADIRAGIAKVHQVPGRMMRVDGGQKFGVIVDFAHTPDALANALAALKEITKGRVIVVFGATGDRDKSKRPIMGEVAVKNADLIFLTDDETYSEDPEAIRQAVYKGIEAAGGAAKTTIIGDRQQAIKSAFAAARAEDIVLLPGMGDEDYRVMNEGKVPWSEAKIAKELLEKIANK